MHRALVVDAAGSVASLRQMPALAPDAGEVLIAIDWTSINYKDALAVSGAPGILRSTPMSPAWTRSARRRGSPER